MIIKIMMSTASSPIWYPAQGEPDRGWYNSDLVEYEGIFSKELMHSLFVYQEIWEVLNSSRYLTGYELSKTKKRERPESILVDALVEMERRIAMDIKLERPDFTIYFQNTHI